MKKQLLYIFVLVLSTSVFAQNINVLDLRGSDTAFRMDDNGSNDLDVSTAYTFEFWIYVSTAPAPSKAIADRLSVFSIGISSSNGNYKVSFSGTDGSIDGDPESPTFGQLKTGSLSTNELSLNTWYHIAFSMEQIIGTNYLRVFVDGNLQGTSTNEFLDLSVLTNNALSIGAGWGGIGTDPSNYLNFSDAVIDEFRMSNSTRYTTSFTKSKTSLPHTNDANTHLLFHFDNSALPPTNSSSVVFNIINGTLEGIVDPNDIVVGNYVGEGTIGVGGLPLPVELTTFTAQLRKNAVFLDWETATEVNNYGFDVEKKLEIGDWNRLGFIEGHGNSNSPKYYNFSDNSILDGTYSYRLKQIDIDGSFEYSDIVEVNIGTPDNFELNQNFPNPFNPRTSIVYSIPRDGHVTLSIVDVLGNEVAVLENGFQSAGSYSKTFNATNYSSGIYFYRLQAGSFTEIKKMLMMK